MRNIILAAVAAVGLSGCTTGFSGGYGSGVSIGVGSGYGGYGGYNRYAGNSCVAYDRFGRGYYTCGYSEYGPYGGISAASRYPQTYYYPGYTYRGGGIYYDRYGRPYSAGTLYNRYYRRY